MRNLKSFLCGALAVVVSSTSAWASDPALEFGPKADAAFESVSDEGVLVTREIDENGNAIVVIPVTYRTDSLGRTQARATVSGDRGLALNIHVGLNNLQKLVAGAGLIVGRFVDTGAGFSVLRGVLIEATAGQGGATGSLGYGFFDEALESAIKITALRTYGQPWGSLPNEWYVGAELTSVLNPIGIQLTSGFFKSVGGANRTGQTRFTFGAGFNFGALLKGGD